MTTSTITRFAPSPTGGLHLGHAWSALLAHDFARAAGGRFLLRIEDIDRGRCRPEHVAGIFADLQWLGLDWEGDVLVQSTRGDVYAQGLERLTAMGVTYRCWCTRKEIAEAGGAPQGDVGALYPGTCKGRDDPGDGRAACWRLDVATALAITGPLVWRDGDRVIAALPETLGDVVIARKDAQTSYHLAVTLDDAAQGVSDVVRGADLFASTHIHRLLQALLGLPVPHYHHHALLCGSDGERLAKRKQAPTIASLREMGADPVKLIAAMRDRVFPFGFALAED
jgi:glutamyl-Q tRNA(Asp) synthetase